MVDVERHPSAASLTSVAGIDVGGTFTDLVLLDGGTNRIQIAKTLTTLENQAFGVINALTEADARLAELGLIVHGTTTTTNAVLERKLARTGLITTRGFRDVLELGRRTRPHPYGMTGEFMPVIPRNLRLEVTERVEAGGAVRTPLDENELRSAVETLVARGCEALVIHFLHAYANPAHERRAAEIARESWPNGYVTMGHALVSEAREFERGVTAAVNASVQPILQRYLERLQSELGQRGFTRDVLVMNGNGGMISARHAANEAAKTVMSGPASGVMAAADAGRRIGIADIITYDMGGTSSDVALIRDAEPAVSSEIEIEYAMPIHVPMVDVRTIGAGGGSIARVNDAGLLEVGPESAGADPGPICYGRGGTAPTISDANLVLGRLNPDALLSVDNPVSVDGLRTIFAESIGSRLGLDADRAAAAVLTVANTQMAGAIRMVSIGRGHDPRDFVLFAFGGAGPLHAVALARELAIPRVVIPPRPGITNALGCVVADLRHDFVNTLNVALDTADMDRVSGIYTSHVREGRRLIEDEPVGVDSVRIVHSADMQFIGQTHVLRVEVPDPAMSRADLQAAFEDAYFRRFRVELPEIRAQIVNLNTAVIGIRPPLDLSALIDPAGRKASLEEARSSVRPVWFEGGWRDTPVYRRDHLPAAAEFEGPAIVEQLDTTVVVAPGDRVRSDADNNLIIDIGETS